MDDVERAKLAVRLDDERQTLARLIGQLRDKQSFHAAAWAEYGSELCAGGMQNEEKAIREEIDGCKAEISLLESGLSGRLDLSDEHVSSLQRGIDRAQALIDGLSTQRKQLLKELAACARLRARLE